MKKIVLIFMILFTSITFADDKAVLNFREKRFNLAGNFSLNDISKLSLEEAALLRNGIYAKYGYEFNKEQYKKYFGQFSWYAAKSGNVEKLLNKTDRENIENLMKYEKIRESGVNSSEFSGYYEKKEINENGIKIKSEDIETDEGNNPKKVTITAGKSKVFFESMWNDGLTIGVVDFDKTDRFTDIFITESGTDVAGVTYIYRYDGNTISEYCTIEQSILKIYYDENGIIYFSDWDNNSDGFRINKQLNYKTKTVSVIKDKKIYDKLNGLKR